MYLKEIKLLGFKSFADKTDITFDKGISCIVGPNGAGKSNIVDAVRWVLGEQSVKSLRGEGAMSDVIFSGSKSRDHLNVASVELIFDNYDKYLPVDYTLVSVKRKVYVTGENEYFLNGEQCRLKDIIDLLADSGMGKASFNIISQGEISHIINSRPEERRVIFEEAAGVLKYKRRKEEAIRKIERTNENLNRVNDIIQELEPNLIPLKEQSEKAKEYLDIKKELESIEIALIVHDIDNLNYEYQETKKQIEKLTEELITLSAKTTTEGTDIEKEKGELQQIDRELYEAQQELVELSSKAEKLNAQRQMITERKKYDKKDAKIHDNVIKLTEEKLKLTNDIYSLENDISSNKETIDEYDKNINLLTLALNDLRKERIELINELDNQKHQERELNHKIELLRNAIENDTGLNSAVRHVINNPKLDGIHGVIGKLIDVKEKYALAIETSLGPSMQFIVVDNETKAKECINYLKNNNLGRATFFPLNVITPRGIDNHTLEKIFDHPDYLGCAADFVKYDQKYRNIILNQLGNVLLATDIDAANKISKLINYQYKIVTLDGELVHVGGSITGGAYKRSNGMIREKYELEGMLRQVTSIVNNYQKIELKIKDLDKQIKEQEDSIFNLNSKRVSCEESNNSKLNLLNQYKAELEAIDNELNDLDSIINDAIDKEEAKVVDAYYKILKEKEATAKKIDRLSHKRNILISKIEELEALIRSNNSAYNKKQEELKNLEIKVNRMDVKLDTLLNSLNEEYSLTYEKAKENYKLEIDVDEARIKVNTNRTKIKSFGLINLGAIEEYERINKRYTFLTTQKEDLIKAEQTLLDIIKEMDTVMEENFITTFRQIQTEFKTVFKKLFSGGHAELKLTNPDNILETGIDIIASPPGKKLQHLSLLSGGEKALTAIALLFAILNTRPVPFCLFDEIEAALDEVNVETFGEYLKTYKDKTQFIIITHKKKTMEYADILYGITMQESGVSKLVSVKLENIDHYVTN
ncbi:MAG: AAA family ATPase [Bacilli bacterium]|jgi:chromosome segregation protein